MRYLAQGTKTSNTIYSKRINRILSEFPLRHQQKKKPSIRTTSPLQVVCILRLLTYQQVENHHREAFAENTSSLFWWLRCLRSSPQEFQLPYYYQRVSTTYYFSNYICEKNLIHIILLISHKNILLFFQCEPKTKGTNCIYKRKTKKKLPPDTGTSFLFLQLQLNFVIKYL